SHKALPRVTHNQGFYLRIGANNTQTIINGDTMVSTELLVNTFTTLLVTIDPPGLVPVFLGLTAGMSAIERKQVALRGSIIAFALLAVFAIFGSSILGALGISMGAFRIAGGLLLFFIAFEMIFEKRTERK